MKQCHRTPVMEVKMVSWKDAEVKGGRGSLSQQLQRQKAWILTGHMTGWQGSACERMRWKEEASHVDSWARSDLWSELTRQDQATLGCFWLFYLFPQLGDHPSGVRILWSARIRHTFIGFRIDRHDDRRVQKSASLLSVRWHVSECLTTLRVQMFPELRCRKLKAKKNNTSKQSCCVQLNYTSPRPKISWQHHSD